MIEVWRREDPVDPDRVIHAIYDAALDPLRWPSALEMLGDLLGGCAVGTSIQGSSGYLGTLGYPRLDPALFAKMDERFRDVRTNEMVAVMSGLPTAVAVPRQTAKSDETYFRSPLFNEIYAPQRLTHAAVACACRCSDVFVPLGIFRRQSQDEFGPREFALLKLVLPHLDRAIRITLRIGLLEAGQAASHKILDRLPFGAILIDRTSRVQRMNSAAQAIVSAGDGMSIRNDRLFATSAADDRNLQNAIASALHSGRAGRAAVSRPSLARPLLLLAIPSAPCERLLELMSGGALVLLSDPERQVGPSSDALMQLFDLTPAQARLAGRLAVGDTLAEAARELGIGYETARSHVKEVFRRVGVARQSELIRTILSSAVVLDEQMAVHAFGDRSD